MQHAIASTLTCSSSDALPARCTHLLAANVAQILLLCEAAEQKGIKGQAVGKLLAVGCPEIVPAEPSPTFPPKPSLAH